MDIERQVNELTERVAALEAAVQHAKSAQTPPSPTPVAPSSGAPVGHPEEVGHPQAAAHVPTPPAPASVQPPPSFTWPTAEQSQETTKHEPAFEIGIETLLRWAGVVLVALAGIFLVSTAISRGWIGPELQLVGAAIGGGALLAAALKLSPSRAQWALALGSAGTIVLAVSALAAHEWLDVVGPGVAVGLLAVAMSVSIIVALETRIEGIALVTAVFGMLASIDTFDNFGGGAILGWVAACIIGSSALGLAKEWPGLRLITGWLGAAALLNYAIANDVEGSLQAMGFVGAAIIAVTLWAGPTVAHRLGPSDGPGYWGSFDWQPLDYRLVAIVPAWAWAVVSALLSSLEDQRAGLFAIITAAGFIALAALTWQRVPRLVSISTIFGSMALLALGFAIYLDGPALMVALAGQAITSYYLANQLDDDLLRYNSYAVGLVSSAIAVYEMAYAVDHDGFANAGYVLATLLVVGCWAASAVLLHNRDDVAGPFDLLFIGAWIGTMLWLAAALIGVPQGLLLISVAWTAMACAGLIVGLTQPITVIKNVALATLVGTLFKLVRVDMAEVEVFWRVGLFFVVGMGFIALGLKVPSLTGSATNTPVGEPDGDEVTERDRTSGVSTRGGAK